jgi:hypothetical protein
MSYIPLSNNLPPAPSEAALDVPPASWDTLRKQARHYENDIESKLASFAKSVAIVSSGNMRSGSATELEVEELLNKVELGNLSLVLKFVIEPRCLAEWGHCVHGTSC